MTKRRPVLRMGTSRPERNDPLTLVLLETSPFNLGWGEQELVQEEQAVAAAKTKEARAVIEEMALEGWAKEWLPLR